MAFDDVMNQLLNSPGFNMGMALLGNTHNPNGLADAQKSMFAWQQGQREAQQLAQEKAYREAQIAQQRQHSQDLAKLYQAQIGQYGQKTANEAQQLKLLQRQQQIREAILKHLGSTIPGFAIPPVEGNPGVVPQPQQPQQDSGNPFNPQSLSPGEEIMQPDGTQTPANIAPLDNGDMQMPQAPTLPQMPQLVPQSMPQAAPKGPTGKYGTPAAILDNLKQVESSGNPKAVNPKSGALGAYQFLPTTARQLNAEGVRFNPMDEQQSRDAADYYLQKLVAQNGGDYRKALADYGGFKAKDPSAYVGKVLAGVNLNGAPSSPVQVPGSATPPNAGVGGLNGQTPQQLAQLGTLMDIAGLKGQGLYEQAKLAMPQNVPANSYRVDPNTGNSTYMPSPVEERRLAMEQKKQQFQQGTSDIPGLPPEEAAKMKAASMQSRASFVEKNYDKVASIPDSLLAVQHAKQAYPSAKIFMGSQGEMKMNIAKFLNSNLGWMGVNVKPEELGNAELLRAALFQPVVGSLKSMDSQPSESQQKAMQQAFGTIDTYDKAIPKLLDMIDERLKLRLQAHNNMVDTVSKGGIDLNHLHIDVPTAMPLDQLGAFANQPAAAPAPTAAPKAAPSSGTMTLDEYIKKHRRK